MERKASRSMSLVRVCVRVSSQTTIEKCKMYREREREGDRSINEALYAVPKLTTPVVQGYVHWEKDYEKAILGGDDFQT